MSESLREKAENLKAARTAWLESHGVPISMEFVRFAEAIGELTDLIEAGAGSAPATLQPTYYVRHPDDSYSVADPQPSLDFFSATAFTDSFRGRGNRRAGGGTGTQHGVMEAKKVIF